VTHTTEISPDSEPVLRVSGATKHFGAITAVDDVSFYLGRGEILALLGDNGAGKSTLIKCISGVHRLDSGEIQVEGSKVNLRSPADARHHGIETVYQDLALFDDLDVAANLFAGRELARSRGPAWGGWMNGRRMRQVARETLDGLAVNVPTLQASVKLLSGGQRQAIAVARAVQFATRVVILDEPTAALGVRETRNVLQMIRYLPQRGVSVLVISHNLDHVSEIADRAIVLRRGRKIGEARPDASGHEQIVRMIVGAHAEQFGDAQQSSTSPSTNSHYKESA
jgi:D-xylose transport system ATP-binding protein